MDTVLNGETVQKNKIAFTTSLFFLLCVNSLASYAQDNYFFFRAYDVLSGGDHCQLKGYTAVRYASSGEASAGSSSHTAGSRFFVPVKNGEIIARETLFKGKSVLRRNTKLTSVADKRESTASTGKHSSTSSVTSHDSIVTMDFSTRRRKNRKSGNGGADTKNDRSKSPKPVRFR